MEGTTNSPESGIYVPRRGRGEFGVTNFLSLGGFLLSMWGSGVRSSKHIPVALVSLST